MVGDMKMIKSSTCTPNDVYNLEPEETINVFNGTNEYYGSPHSLWGCYYNHVPEIKEEDQYGKWEHSRRIKMRVYKHFNFDGRRWWRLASIWFDEQLPSDHPFLEEESWVPVMIIRNAGREGDDFRDRFITDVDAYRIMVKHIFSLRILADGDINTENDIVDSDVEIKDLLNFYGNSLNGWFERY